MKRCLGLLSLPALVVLTVSGCAPKPPAELVTARNEYNRVQSEPAGQVNRAGVMDARQALDAAERRFDADPSSHDVNTLGYVATRKAQIAEADGRTTISWFEQQAADKRALELEVSRAKRENAELREQASTSERRARVALEQLGLEAKDEARGTVITLPNAKMFASNQAEILPDARQRLEEIAKGIKQVIEERQPQDAGRKMMLIGYTDSTGSDAHNRALSERRAEAVKKFFAGHGLDASMMQVEGRGEADPVADNKTTEGRAKNRRVEVVISPPAGGGGEMQP